MFLFVIIELYPNSDVSTCIVTNLQALYAGNSGKSGILRIHAISPCELYSMWFSKIPFSGVEENSILKDKVEFPPRRCEQFSGQFRQWKVKGHVSMSKVTRQGQHSNSGSWRIGHDLLAPLADRSRTSTVQIRASYF